MKITACAHGKINWALNITGLRSDGYHELDMLMQSIALGDDMVFEDAAGLTLTVDGRPDPDPERNLVIRAARALMTHTGTRHGAAISLNKHVPARAGLGGGSADCALTLRALNRLWALGLRDDELLALGAKLGADVPFCLTGGLARVRGIGEQIVPIEVAPSLPLVLVTPGGGLSTAEVFRLWDQGRFPPVELDADRLAAAIVRKDLTAVDILTANALTAPALTLLPEIGEVMNQLRGFGSPAVFMTGSGSTVVAAFDSPEKARSAAQAIPHALLTHTLSELELPRT